jgi:hypothetical protein
MRLGIAMVVLAACGNHPRETPPAPPTPKPLDAAVDATAVDAPVAVDLDKIFDNPVTATTQLRDVDTPTLSRAFREYGSCANAAVIGDVLLRRGALGTDWGPEPGASAAQLSHDICVSSNDSDREHRRPRLLRYLAPRVTFVDSKCHDHKSEKRDEKTFMLDSGAAVDRIDACPNSAYAVTTPCNGPTCELVAPGATRVLLTWTGGKLTRVECAHGGMMTCTDH